MAVMKMSALTLVGPQTEMETAAKQLLLTGNFQPMAVDSLVNDQNVRAKLTASVENPYDELMSKLEAVWKIAGETPPQPDVSVLSEFTLTETRYRVDRLTQKLDLWKKLRDSLKETGYSPEALLKSDFLNTRFGRMPAENYERLLANDRLTFVANKMMEADGNVWLLILAPAHKEKELQPLLDSLGFVEYSALYGTNRTPQEMGEDELLAVLTQQIEKHTHAMNGLAVAARGLLDARRKELTQLYSHTAAMQRIYELCRQRGEIDGVYTVSGWVLEDKLDDMRQKLAQCAPSSSVIVENTKELDIPVPVALKNSRLFAPFEQIVAMYSLPSYGELDPSPLVAFTFTLFFGFMFGDVGHGLLIFLAALYAQKKGIANRAFAFIMKAAAVSSMFFGLLYGSVFGQEGIIEPLWLLPMENTQKLIMVSIVIGFGTISLGMLVNTVKQFRAKNYAAMLFGGQSLAGLALYWLFTALVILYATGNSAQPVTKVVWAACGVTALAMALRSVLARVLLRQKDDSTAATNIFGIVEDLLSFLSNTASFVRLAAFTLNHVGLSMAIITLAEMMRGAPGGIVLKALMLIAGNLLITVLEGLIVFIQTLRLEYYEFFGKFFTGGGQKFKPVKLA